MRNTWYNRDDFIKMIPYEVDFEIIDENIHLNRRILVKDKFGICKVSPRNITRGAKPCLSSAVDKTSYRLSMFKSIHGENISYPDYIFNGNDKPVKIKCNRCNKIGSVIDCNIIKKGSGCRYCDTTIGAPRMTHEDFINRLGKIENFEILGIVEKSDTPILCRNKYGLIELSPSKILNGQRGSLHSAIDKTSYMIEQFKEKHGNKYDYSKFIYCGNRCLGEIICKKHGVFKQYSDSHLMGSGCVTCANESDNRIKGYNRSSFVKVSKNRECVLYIINAFNNDESFYKIGITSHSVKYRFKRDRLGYKYTTVYEYKSFDASHIWNLEKLLHRKYKDFKYVPEIYFKGNTECFNLNLPIEEIKNFLK